MKISLLILCTMALAGLTGAVAQGQPSADTLALSKGELRIHPINHATLALTWDGKAIYVDPVGDASLFTNLPAPTVILLTDIHGDHLNKTLVAKLASASTKIIASSAVTEQLPEDLKQRTITLTNGQQQTLPEMTVEAIAAYNLAPDRQKFHAKGRGNGYLISLDGKRIYISGDTEDTPELRALKNIDLAFLCMNLPYTMTVEQAAEAVKAFKPKVVYPYHYRGSDLNKFKELVGNDSGVEVRLRDWYKTAPAK